jgi:hypothetical protein
MKKYLFILLFLISTVVSFSQTIEFGPLIQYHRTAFQKPDSGTIVITTSGGSSEGVKTTETDANIAFGGYFGYYTENTFAYLVELFYVATSSPNYGNNSFQSINLVPSVAAELGNSNIFINLGVGAGFILNQPGFEGINDVVGEKFNSIDILAKLAFNFRLKELFTLDGGVLMGVSDIVDDQNRFHFYLGARVPLNLLIN